MIRIKITSDETSSIFVYDDNDNLLSSVKRKYYFGTKTKGEFFKDDLRIAVVTNSIFKIKILEQNFEEELILLENNLRLERMKL